MSFMQPEIYESDYYAVEANHGETHIVPADVCCAVTYSDLSDYVEGRIDEPDEPAVISHGWLCRLHAPGYLDSTEWSAFDSESEAIEFILDFYGTQDDGPREDWEIQFELRKLELQGLGRFECVEHSTHYAVRDRITGDEHPMGDGVDLVFGPASYPIRVGQKLFREEWERDLNLRPDETLHAYFPVTWAAEND